MYVVFFSGNPNVHSHYIIVVVRGISALLLASLLSEMLYGTSMVFGLDGCTGPFRMQPGFDHLLMGTRQMDIQSDSSVEHQQGFRQS